MSAGQDQNSAALNPWPVYHEVMQATSQMTLNALGHLGNQDAAPQELMQQFPYGNNPESLNLPSSPMEAMLDISEFFDAVGLDIQHGFNLFPSTGFTTGQFQESEHINSLAPSTGRYQSTPESQELASNGPPPMRNMNPIPDTGTGEGEEAYISAAASRLDTMKAILLLATYSTWQEDSCIVRESLEYPGLLARCLRESGLVNDASHTDEDLDWHSWARAESDRRAKLAAFCFLNLQTLVFNVPPVILANEIDLWLPVTCDEWMAPSAALWLETRSKSPPLVRFQEAFVNLVQPRTEECPVPSPFGNFVMIHAILQRLIVAKQLSLDPASPGYAPEEVAKFESSLHRWRDQWCKAPESVLDVRHTKGSLSWTATSLLGLAHVRLHFASRRPQEVCSGNPKTIAGNAWDARPPERGPQLVYALLHAVHALNIPVQLGIDYLASCQAFFWSLQHCFCSFEAAVFLSKWLYMLAETQDTGELDINERQIISWIECVVNEALASVEAIDGYDLSTLEDNTSHSLETLGRLVIKLFAKMFERCNSAWPIMRTIGQSLHEYASLLDEYDKSPSHYQKRSIDVSVTTRSK
ncbi:regulatory protein [Colletotrichum abscissum]|uniref:regulatory protein n=1 Tax=Colletotrichum abscissum TaxID=1671311 RepID=UPI0027D74A67|nr:regulatory protein [Colletotrichum abscissum]KAK1521172.1 regulatory protein [Colletotrichum abscissum]